MDRLEEAREQAKQSQYREDVKEAMYSVHLAIAHALIAIVERMDKAAEDAELEAERKERWQEYQARCKAGTAL